VFAAAFQLVGFSGDTQLLVTYLLVSVWPLPFAAVGGLVNILGDRARARAAPIHAGADHG